jgi:hypothetical protein
LTPAAVNNLLDTCGAIKERGTAFPLRTKNGNKPNNLLTEKLPYKSANFRFLSGGAEKVMSIDEVACRLMGTEREVPAACELALKIKLVLREQVGACPHLLDHRRQPARFRGFLIAVPACPYACLPISYEDDNA